MKFNRSLEEFRDSVLLFGILTFSLPLKTPAIQSFLESILQISFPIQLSTYTLFLPFWLGISVLFHLRRIPEVWNQVKTPLLLMALLFVWMWLGAWFSEWRDHSLKHAGRYSIHLLVFLTFLLLVRSQNFRSMAVVLLSWFLVVSGLTIAENFFPNWRLQPWLASLGLRLEIHWVPEGHRLSSLFENPNPYGIISTSMLGIGLFLFLQKHLILGIMGAFAAIWGVVQSGSRNPVFTLFICIFCMLLIFSKKLKWNQLQKYQYLITLISVLLILSLGTLFFFENPLVNRLNPVIRDLSKINSITEILELDKLRSELYISVIDYLINNQNLLGTGPKTFEFLDDFSHLSPNQRYHAHNAWLTIWVEMGWVGLSLAFGFIASWFWKFRRASLCLWFSVLVLCLGQMLDYFIWQITFMTVQSLIFILMAASSNYGSSKDQ